MILTLSERRLGKKAPVVDRRTFKFARYLKAIPPPLSKDWTLRPGAPRSWPMLLNDVEGDCVVAGALHLIELWTALTGNPLMPSNADAQAIYEIFGYRPGDSSTDNGIDMLSFLKYWRKTGLPVGGKGKTHRIIGFASVNASNVAEVAQSIELFGGLYLGLAMPASAQTGQIWSVPDGLGGDAAPGSWGGHCVPVLADSIGATYPHGLKPITWGAVYGMTWHFLQCYADEAYAVFAPEWINATTGLSPSSFDYAQLLADLDAL